MDDFHKRLGDWEFHVIEEIILDDRNLAKHSWFQDTPQKKNTNPEIKFLLENIENNEDYYFENAESIDGNTVENWDIVEIKFFKDYKQKDISIVMRFFIKMRYSGSMLWFIHVFDNSTLFTSKARMEKLALPIMTWWKRKVILTESLSEAVIVSTNQFMHESRIKEIKIYKKWQKQEWIKWFFKNKIWWLLKK